MKPIVSGEDENKTNSADNDTDYILRSKIGYPKTENTSQVKNTFDSVQNSQSQDKTHQQPLPTSSTDMNSVSFSHHVQNLSYDVSHQRTKDIVFLVWAPSSSRAEGLANAINAELYQLYYKFKRKVYSPIKYPLLFIKSLLLLSRLRPSVIICQEPPAFCSAAGIAYHYFWNRKSRVVIDAHTAAFKAPWSYFRIPQKFLLNRAFLVVVTNDELRDTVMKQYRVRPFVLPDKIALMEGGENTNDANPKTPRLTTITFPQITNDYDHRRNTDVSTAAAATKGEYASKPISQELRCFRMVVICSFSPDEPIAEVLQAAEMLPEIEFCITGDYTRASGNLEEKITQNVVLTGYLNRMDYVALLRSADAIIALTKRDGTMLSGANEAFALSKPLITSGWPSLRNYFSKAAIYVSDHHTPEEIAEAVIEVASRKDELVKESEHLKNIRTKEWQERFEDFKAILIQDSELQGYFKRIPGNVQENKSSAKDGKTSSSAA